MGCPIADRKDRSGTGAARFVDVRCVNDLGTEANQFNMLEPWSVQLTIECSTPIQRPRLAIIILTANGVRVTRMTSFEQFGELPTFNGRTIITCRLIRPNLVPGPYTLTLKCAVGNERLDYVERAFSFDVLPVDVSGTGRVPTQDKALCYLSTEWEVRPGAHQHQEESL